MFAALIPALAGVISKVVDRTVPDVEEAKKLKRDLQLEMLSNQHELERISAQIIREEAKGESWLQRNWRPLTMLTFLVLVGAYWLGFTPEGLPAAAVESMFDLLQLGIGGYIIGRSGEKIVREVSRPDGALDKWRSGR